MSRLAALWDEWALEDAFGDSLGVSVSSGSGVLPSVTFPTSTHLVTRVQIALGADLSADPLTWNWLDITEWVRHDLGISLSTGRRDEASQLSTGSARMKLDNRDGRFTRRNPTGPYYGLLSKNTPIWATVDAGSGEKTRLEMFVNDWPTRWTDKSATDSTVTIRCAGILRRLGQGEVFQSPLRRVYLGSTQPTVSGYWPCEDEEGSTTVASGLSSGPPLAGVTPHFTSGTVVGSVGVLDLTQTGVGLGATTVLSSSSGFQIEATFVTDAVFATVLHIFTVSCGNITAQPLSLIPALADGAPHHIAYRFAQSGADVIETTYRDGVAQTPVTLAGFTLSSALTLNPYPVVGDTNLPLTTGVYSLAHVAVYSFADMDVPTTRLLAVDGYSGEMAHARVERLCNEEGVLVVTTAAESTTMGPQGIDTLPSLLRECERADLGALYEKRWGLAYKSRRELYNQPVSLALDFDQGHIADLPEPADDDQRTRNKWTVSRVNGSEATAEQTTGPMGTAPGGPGVYPDSVTINVETDAQLPDQASFRVHQGTIDEDRWPSIGLNFAHDPDLIDAFTAAPFGARITVANPLPQMPPDDLDLIVEGHSESWDRFLWTASLNCSPASAYRVAIVEDAAADQEIPRIGSGTAVLAAGYTSSDTSFSVTTGTGGLWTTLAASFPLDINIAGERIRLSAISGAASPQTFTVSARSVNGVSKAQVAGARVELWRISTVGL